MKDGQILHRISYFSICRKWRPYANFDEVRRSSLIIKNQKSCFQNTIGVSAGLSDFRKLVITSIKTTFSKCPPKVKTYRDMKSFNKAAFKKDLKAKLQNIEKTYSNLERLSQAYLINTHQKNRRLCVQIVSQMSLRL